jgi:hypothetical protein
VGRSFDHANEHRSLRAEDPVKVTSVVLREKCLEMVGASERSKAVQVVSGDVEIEVEEIVDQLKRSADVVEVAPRGSPLAFAVHRAQHESQRHGSSLESIAGEIA